MEKVKVISEVYPDEGLKNFLRRRLSFLFN